MIETAVPSLTESIKRIVANVLGTMQLSDTFTGTVTKTNPLTISITPQHVLTENFLILTNAVKDHDVDITVSWKTQNKKHLHGNGNYGQNTTETELFYDIKGRKKITVHNGLTVGEKVLLLRQQGGQNYIVVDRLSKLETSGEDV